MKVVTCSTLDGSTGGHVKIPYKLIKLSNLGQPAFIQGT